jgi:hypothetical protein
MELNRLASGAVLKVIATDAGSQRDFRTLPAWPVIRCCSETAEAGVYLLAAQGLSLFQGSSMFKVLRDWMQRYFSDEEAVVLAVLLFLAFTAVLTLGGMLAPVLAGMVLAF